MSGYKGYKPEDNQKRKSNNTNDNHFESDTNTNTKSWTTYGSAMSDYQFKRAVEEQKHKAKSTLKVYTQEELEAFAKARGMKCSKK